MYLLPLWIVPIEIEDILLSAQVGVYKTADSTEFEFKLITCMILDKLLNFSNSQLFDI